jgi:hypothetical protein
MVVHLELRISRRIFEKIQNGPNGIIRGLGETDPCRKTEVENLVALSLYRDTIRVLRSYLFSFETGENVSVSHFTSNRKKHVSLSVISHRSETEKNSKPTPT